MWLPLISLIINYKYLFGHWLLSCKIKKYIKIKQNLIFACWKWLFSKYNKGYGHSEFFCGESDLYILLVFQILQICECTACNYCAILPSRESAWLIRRGKKKAPWNIIFWQELKNQLQVLDTNTHTLCICTLWSTRS